MGRVVEGRAPAEDARDCVCVCVCARVWGIWWRREAGKRLEKRKERRAEGRRGGAACCDLKLSRGCYEACMFSAGRAQHRRAAPAQGASMPTDLLGSVA